MLLLEGAQSGNFLSCNRPYQPAPQRVPDSSYIKPLVDNNPYTKVPFAKAVLRGAKEVDRTNSYSAISKDNELTGIYLHSNRYLKEIKTFLANPDYSTDQKIIVVCLIQNLSLEDYLHLLSYTAELYKHQKIEEMLLSWVIAPNFNKRQIIARCYKDPRVRTLLLQIRQMKGLSETPLHIINQILTGDETKFLK